MAFLYELGQQYMELLSLAEEGECDEQAIIDTMESLEGEIEDKVDGCAYVIRELSGMSEVIDKEIERLQARKKSIDNNADRIKRGVQQIMVLTGKQKIKTAKFTFSIRKKPASVVLETTDTAEIPERFLKYPSPTISKSAIAEALKAGEDLSGIAHFEQGEGLTIT